MTRVKPETVDYWFIFNNHHLLLRKEGNLLHIPTSSMITPFQLHLLREHRLGLFNEVNCYCAEISKETLIPDEMESIPLRQALEQLGTEWYRAAVKAHAVMSWDKNHHYCGHCATKTQHKPDTFERQCPSCALIFYPRISPSIIVLIKKEDQILMARGPHFTAGAYGLIAGFVEPGENIEEAIRREVKEEVDIEIKNLRYFGSQAWPFPDSLMLAFIADYTSGELKINQSEIEAAGWYTIDNLPGRPSSSISIARKLIEHFIEEQKGHSHELI